MLSCPDMTIFVLRGPAEVIVASKTEKENKLMLLVGKVITNVKKMLSDGYLEVEMSQAIAGARGTTYVMEEDGFTSTLKVLEGTVSFKPNNGEELLITDGQMVSATNGVAGEITSFSIEEELSDWDETTQTRFREILAEASQKKEDSHASQEEQQAQQSQTEVSEIPEKTEKRNGILPIIPIIMIVAGTVVLLAAIGVILPRKKQNRY